MKNRTSLRLKGRFFKGDDPTTKIIDVSNFDLMEICDYPISFPDNPHANIFHSKLHKTAEMAQVISTSKLVNTEFVVNDARPVIKPLDFTGEWRRIRNRMTDRQSRSDDDDIYYEQEGHTMTLRQKVKDAMNEIKQKTTEGSSSNPPERKLPTDGSAIPVKSEVEQMSDHHDHDLAEQASVPHESKARIEPSANNPFHFASEAPQKELLKQEGHPNQEDGFVPMPEAVAHQVPHKTLVAQPTPQELQSALQESQAKGYEEGFRLGEEKALISVQDKIHQTMQEVHSIVHELEGLKSNILNNAQENFQILCQAMMESLLQQQFSINPGTFQKVIQRAIDEAVPDDKFVIHVSPKAFENLKDFADEKFIAKLKVDQELKQHDFKIESNLTVVDGNVSQIITDLLDEAETKLFDSPEKVS